MNKIFLILITLFLVSNCSYKPILTGKKSDFTLENITSNNNSKTNVIIKTNLLERSDNTSNNNYDIYFSTEDQKEIVSSNENGDPTVFKIKVIVNYSLSKNNKIIFTNEIVKQVNYNNIDDKFELLKYEENILNDLLKNISLEILSTITNLN
ncbi:hypothetical protein OA617_00445 [Candidatus Pelagibacter sp.]|nr:hypothetical protein [Candidatus Pelagibacter sp.]|tara:strand:- start:740 stop:1195 length:456 start_codon:yes stop_codon:yes gene_type:complete